jgi:hypothetical protein
MIKARDREPLSALWLYVVCLQVVLRTYEIAEKRTKEIESVLGELGARVVDESS